MARSETTAPAARRASAPPPASPVAAGRSVFHLRRPPPGAHPPRAALAGGPHPRAAQKAAPRRRRGADALARLLWPPSADALGEAYLRGDIDIEGDIWTAIDAGRAFDLRRLGRALPRLARLGLELRRGAAPAPRLKRVARLSGRRHSRARDLAAIRFHYDVGNDFYALWLDRRLVYSCAYFETPETTLDDAQEAKLDLICRKLRLEPGMRLLDIGCGWGSLVIFAAERYGVEATGITLSATQADWAAAEIHRRELGDRARVMVRDYRDLDGLGRSTRSPRSACSSTSAASGWRSTSRRPSPPCGRAGCSSTTGSPPPRRAACCAGAGSASATAASWAATSSPMASSSASRNAVGVARRAGFELLDAQSLRPHYALTLKAWVERLEASADRARELVGEEVYRTWRLYMAAARGGFEEGSLDVAQLLLARPGPGGPAELPLRPWWPA